VYEVDETFVLIKNERDIEITIYEVDEAVNVIQVDIYVHLLLITKLKDTDLLLNNFYIVYHL